MPRFYSISFYQNRPEIKLISPKNTKFSSSGGSAARLKRCSREAKLLSGGGGEKIAAFFYNTSMLGHKYSQDF